MGLRGEAKWVAARPGMVYARYQSATQGYVEATGALAQPMQGGSES